MSLSPALHASLDRPVWSALEGGHRHLALGGPLARRYPREIDPFAVMGEADAGEMRADWTGQSGSFAQPTHELREFLGSETTTNCSDGGEVDTRMVRST